MDVWPQTGHIDKDTGLKVWEFKFKIQHPEQESTRKTPGRAWRMV